MQKPAGLHFGDSYELPGCVQQPNTSRQWQIRLVRRRRQDVAMQRTAHTILCQHDRRNGRQQPLERNEPRCRGDALVLEEVERHRVSKCERAGPRTAQASQIRSAPQPTPELVRQRSHVESARTHDPEAGAPLTLFQDLERRGEESERAGGSLRYQGPRLG